MKPMVNIRRAYDNALVSVPAEVVARFNTLRPFLAQALAGVSANDATEITNFAVNSLVYTETDVISRQYAPLMYEELLPITAEAGEWAEMVRYRLKDWAGRGRPSSGLARDIPKVDIQYGDKYFPILDGNLGYDYTMNDLRKAAALRIALPGEKEEAAVEGFRRHMNLVGISGEKETGLTGLINNPNVPVANAPNGNWAGPNSTPAKILADVNALIIQIWIATVEQSTPTHIVLPRGCLGQIASQARSDLSDKTILAYLRDNNVAKQQKNIDIQFRTLGDLDTAGVGGTRRMVGYEKNKLNLVMHIPMPIKFLAPQPAGTLIEVPGEYKYSGVAVKRVKTMAYYDGL